MELLVVLRLTAIVYIIVNGQNMETSMALDFLIFMNLILKKKLKLEKLKTLEHLTQYFAPKTVRFIISLLSMGQIIFLKLN